MNNSPFQLDVEVGNLHTSVMNRKEKDAIRAAKWRAENPERYRAILLRSLAKCRDARLARRRKKYRENPGKDYERCREWQKNNPDYNATWLREDRKKHPDKYRKRESRRVRPLGQRNAALRKWSAKKQATDLNWRLIKNLRTRLWWALKKNTKSATTEALLGCSIPDFKIYLESLFEPEMSWSNYGNKKDQWSVDHIIPCDLFDMTKPEHQRRCFHFSNLRPFWHLDNLRKGAKHKEQIS